MAFLDVQTTSWSLDPQGPIRRRHPRPAVLRHADFEDGFDALTVVYDCFWIEDGRRIALIGPPLLNLEADLELSFEAVPQGDVCAARRVPGFHMDSFVVDVPAGTRALRLRSRAGEAYLVPQPALPELFQGRRVLTTLSKDNELVWIRDWAAYHSRAHGCDAVLLYDNGSVSQSVGEIHEALASLPGLQVVVLRWPFPYGTFDGRRPVSYDIWDWHPCQNAMLEHARRRFLGTARSVLNVDVDELVLTEDGGSVFSLVEESETGHVRLDGLWVENYPARRGATPPRHRDFAHVAAGRRNGCEEKWAVVPGRTPPEAQWAVHEIFGMAATEHHRRAQLRHFKALNTDWAGANRAGDLTPRTASSPADPSALEEDAVLAARLGQVFPEEDEGKGPLKMRQRERSAEGWRLQASRLHGRGRLAEAIAAARRAVERAEDQPAFRLLLAQLLEEAGQPEEAAAEKERVRSLREADALYRCQFARPLIEERCFDRAEEDLRASLALAPDLPAPHLHLARLLDRSGRRGESLAVLERAVDRAPAHALSRARLASRLLEDGRYPEARAQAARAVELNPWNPHYHALLGEALRLMGRLDEAEVVLRRGIGLDAWPERRTRFGRDIIERGADPYDRWAQAVAPTVRHQLAYVFLAKGRPDLAEAALAEAIALGPPAVDDHIFLARIRLRAGAASGPEDMARAIRLARQEFERPSNNVSTRLLIFEREEYAAVALADLLVETGDPGGAAAVLREASERLPASAAIAVREARLLRRQNDIPGATAVLDAAMRRAPRRADLPAALSDVLRDSDPAGAIEAAERARDLDPTRGDHHLALAERLAAAGRLAEAEEVLSRARALMPQHPDVAVALSRRLERRGDLRGAIALIRDVLALGMEEAWLSSHLGGLLLEVGALEEASDLLQSVVRVQPADALTNYRLGRLHEMRGDLPAAVPFVRRAASSAEDQGWIWSHLGAALVETGALEEGGEALARARALAPDDWLTRYRQGRLLEVQGDLGAAIRAVRSAIRQRSDIAWLWSHLGHLLTEKCLWEDAEAALKQALSLAPGDVATTERLERLRAQRVEGGLGTD